MNFNNRLRETTAKLNVLSETKDINGKYIIDSADDVYNSVVEDFCEKYDISQIWLDEDGFRQSDIEEMDVEELETLINLINEEHGTENEPYTTPLAFCLLDDDTYDVTDLAVSLDNLFISQYESALKTIEASILEVKEEDLIENLREAYETMYNFEWTGWAVRIFLHDDGSFSQSEIVSDSTYFPNSYQITTVKSWNLEGYDFDECDEEEVKSDNINYYINEWHIEKAKESILEDIERGEITKKVVWID